MNTKYFTAAQRRNAARIMEEIGKIRNEVQQAKDMLDYVARVRAQRAPFADMGLDQLSYWRAEAKAEGSDPRGHGGFHETLELLKQMQSSLFPGFTRKGKRFHILLLREGEAIELLRPDTIHDEFTRTSRPKVQYMERRKVINRFFGDRGWPESTPEAVMEKALRRINTPRAGHYMVWPEAKFRSENFQVEKAAILRVENVAFHQGYKAEFRLATPDPVDINHLPKHRYFTAETPLEAWYWLADYHVGGEEFLAEQALPEFVPPGWIKRVTPFAFCQPERDYRTKVFTRQRKTRSAIESVLEMAYYADIFPPDWRDEDED